MYDVLYYLCVVEVIGMMNMKKYIMAMLMSVFACGLYAQEKIGNGLEIDKNIHDFGDVMIDKGPVSCVFAVKNTGEKPAVIYNVVSSCGCTDVKWTREPIRPGGEGKISVTYSNDEGPYPFDKTLTVYFSDVKKPYILKIRGIAHEKKKSLEELYGIRFGALGIKETYIKCGNLEQNGVKSDFVNVANLSDKPIKVDFKDVTENLSVNTNKKRHLLGVFWHKIEGFALAFCKAVVSISFFMLCKMLRSVAKNSPLDCFLNAFVRIPLLFHTKKDTF